MELKITVEPDKPTFCHKVTLDLGLGETVHVQEILSDEFLANSPAGFLEYYSQHLAKKALKPIQDKIEEHLKSQLGIGLNEDYYSHYTNFSLDVENMEYNELQAAANLIASQQYTIDDWSDWGSDGLTPNILIDLGQQIPALIDTQVDCPACTTTYTRPLGDVIIHLNDNHKWSREQIADWLETLDANIQFGGNDDEQG